MLGLVDVTGREVLLGSREITMSWAPPTNIAALSFLKDGWPLDNK
jgi:hypothetical protein